MKVETVSLSRDLALLRRLVLENLYLLISCSAAVYTLIKL